MNIPVLCIGSAALFFVFSGGLREGYLGEPVAFILNFLSPPPDLYAPLAIATIPPCVRSFEFQVHHKYPGHHAVKISVVRKPPAFLFQAGDPAFKSDISVTLEISGNGKILFETHEHGGRSFVGRAVQGLDFCVYRFPEDLAGGRDVACKVILTGNLSDLAAVAGPISVAIVKFPDE